MRMDPRSGISVAEFLNTVEAEDLVRVLVIADAARRGAAGCAGGSAPKAARDHDRISTRLCGGRWVGRREAVIRQRGYSRPCEFTSTTSSGASRGRCRRRSGC